MCVCVRGGLNFESGTLLRFIDTKASDCLSSLLNSPHIFENPVV